MVRQLRLTQSTSPGARAPRQAPANHAGVFALVQPGPSHLPSAENKIWVTRPGRRKLEMGARKNGATLTCVAASCVSWSGLKPIWTFFGHWRKHLRNLKSGEAGGGMGSALRRTAENGEDPTFRSLGE